MDAIPDNQLCRICCTSIIKEHEEREEREEREDGGKVSIEETELFKLTDNGVVHDSVCKAVKAHHHSGKVFPVNAVEIIGDTEKCKFCFEDDGLSKRKRVEVASLPVEVARLTSRNNSPKGVLGPLLCDSLSSSDDSITSILTKAFPLTREPTAKQLKEFNSYEKKAQTYAKSQRNTKMAERDLVFCLADVCRTFGERDPLHMYFFDSADQACAVRAFEFFGEKNVDGVWTPNSCASEMIKKPYSPHQSFLEKGYPVHLFAATSYELHDVLDVNTDAEVPHFTLDWTDGCLTPTDMDNRSIHQKFKLGLFRQNGPSIFAITFSWRGDKSGQNMEKGERADEAAKLIPHIAAKYRYMCNRLFFPSTRKGNVYTLVYYIIPPGWVYSPEEYAEFTYQLQYACEDNYWVKKRSEHLFDRHMWDGTAHQVDLEEDSVEPSIKKSRAE
jgi:hypothetical protein